MRQFLNVSCSLVVVAFLALGVLPSAARAQCAPDGLDAGPCCAPANVVLPVFPAMPAQTTKFICFDNCKPAATANWCTYFNAPVPMQFGGALVCGAYNIPIRVRTCGLNLGFWGGTMQAYYSRNWQASSISGAVNLTVWRFIVNGDLKPTISLTTNPLYRPACQSTFTTVYFSGYIDYVYDCISNTWQVAWNFNHECDGLHHVAGTARPAPSSGFHPTRSFSFVGPGTTFSISATNPLTSGGQIIQEAVRRNDWASSPTICRFEEQASGFFQPLQDVCFCTPNGGPQYNLAAVQASGTCGTKVSPSALGPLIQKRLGTWTNASVYPGVETLLFDIGFLDHTDGCTGVASSQWFEGSETIRGYPGFQWSGVALGTQYEDLGSANKSPTNAATYIGAPHVVNFVLNFNMP